MKSHFSLYLTQADFWDAKPKETQVGVFSIFLFLSHPIWQLAWLLPLARYESGKLAVLVTGHLQAWLKARLAEDFVGRLLHHDPAPAMKLTRAAPALLDRSWGWWKSISAIRMWSRADYSCWFTAMTNGWWTSGCNLNFGQSCLLCGTSLGLSMIEREWPFICRWSNFWLPSDSFSQGYWDLRQTWINWLLRKFWELALCHSAWKWDKSNIIAPFSFTLLKIFLAKVLRLEKQSTKPEKPQKPSAMWFCCQKWQQDSGWLKKPQCLAFLGELKCRNMDWTVKCWSVKSRWCDFCLGRKWWWAGSGAEQGWDSGTAHTRQLHSPSHPQNLLTQETWPSGKVLLQRCGFRLFRLWKFSVWRRGKGQGRWGMKQESGETLPSGWGLGLHLRAPEVILQQSRRQFILMVQTHF